MGVALSARLLLARVGVQESPFLLFFAAVLVAASVGGLGPGLLATALAALFGNFFFMAPRLSLELNDRSQRVQLGMYVAEGAIISGLCAVLQTTRRRAEVNESAARSLERRILQLSEAEQRRIGHDLHDGLGQHLTGVALLSSSLRQKLEAAKVGDLVDDARRVETLLSKAIAWTRDLASNLAPTAVETGGLAPALQDLAEAAEVLFDIRCAFEQEGEAESIAVEPAAAIHLYRIAQEAVSNAVKHGGATEISIRLTLCEGRFDLAVVANGGALPEGWRAGATKGMGLRTMNYRARAIGATLVLRNGDAGGTVLTCRGAVVVAAEGQDDFDSDSQFNDFTTRGG